MINSRCSKEEDSGSGPGWDADPLSPWRGPQTHSETWHAARLHPQSTCIHILVWTYMHSNLNVAYLNEPGSSVSLSTQVVIDKHPVRFFVHKRPHVDFFLEVVSVGPWSASLFVCLNPRLTWKRTAKRTVSLKHHCPGHLLSRLSSSPSLFIVLHSHTTWCHKTIFVLDDDPPWLTVTCVLILLCALCVHRWASGMSWWFLQPVWRSMAQRWQTSWTTTGTSWNADTTDRYCSKLCLNGMY